MWFSFLIFIIGLLACFLGFTNFYKKIEYNKEIETKNLLLQKEQEEWQKKIAGEEEKWRQTNKKVKELRAIQLNYEDTAFKSFASYCDKLDIDYKEKEAEYAKLIDKLSDAYDKAQQSLLDEKITIEQDLEKIRSTRAAAIEAERKEKIIESHTEDYCVIPTQEELDDIHTLERIKPKLNSPRILCMLIWSTYYQKPLTQLCNNILGLTAVTGIYKITNQQTKQCYIGQAVDVATRWKQHAKCGLGIDTPAGNKLYKAMLEDGLYNFSFELLEKCPRSELNEKEKFYIELYQADSYGYNGTKGNN